MKKIFTVLFFIFCVINLQSSTKSIVKLYFNNGKPEQVFNIDSISKMKIKKFTNNFTMTLYYQQGLSVGYQTSAIDTMKFENNSFNIYLSGTTKSYLLSDIDSIIFKQNVFLESVTIGTQIWQTKNLDVATYRNGDIIPQVTDSTEWANLTTGAWCYYDNEPENGKIYGKLYNWYAVNDPRGLAPAGWHVPSDTEWTTLSTYLGGQDVAGGKLKSTGTIEDGNGLWHSPNTGATNSSGFSGLPSGYRYFVNGYYYYLGVDGFWWSSTENSGKVAWGSTIRYLDSKLEIRYDEKGHGFSVRCIKDVPALPDSVIIGTQTWQTKNLDVAYYRNGDPIPQVTDPTEWSKLTTGAWCYYNNDPENGKIYGKLYNWYAVNDPRGLAPAGWHVPSDAEWTTLSTYLGGIDVAGGKLKSTGTIEGGDGLWLSPNTGATNESGFSGLPGGYSNYDCYYLDVRYYGYWWSSTEVDYTNAWFKYLEYYDTKIIRSSYGKVCGFSVRCVKDETTMPDTLVISYLNKTEFSFDISTIQKIEFESNTIDSLSPQLWIDSKTAAPGDNISLNIHLTNAKKLQAANITKINTILKFNSSLLEPTDKSNAVLKDDYYYIGLDLNTTPLDNVDLIKTLSFTATLGNAESTSLTFENIKAIPDTNVKIVGVPGVFTIDVCKEGGPRLVLQKKKPTLKINPNPAENNAEIEYELFKSEKVNIFVLDALGQKVTTLVNEENVIGRKSKNISLEEYLTGVYYIVLQTGTEVRTEKLYVVR
jgi:uncharacterized protein (TIGR02145 family)